MPNLSHIRAALAAHRPVTLAIDARRAAVALILRGRGERLEMLLIRRAEHDADPWSGDLGFPGGKVDPHDVSARSAAERETSEEVGVTLPEDAYLGRLDDIAGAYLPVNVSCFVFHLDREVTLRPNHEISDCWWIPLDRFLDPERHRRVSFTYRRQRRARPVIDLVEPEFPFLWGITYRLIDQFFKLVGHPLPSSAQGE